MASEHTQDTLAFNSLFKLYADALNEPSDLLELAAQCRMRRFYLESSEDDTYGKTLAEGVVFKDGMVALHWKCWTALHDTVDDLLSQYCGKVLVRFVDTEKAS